MRANPPKNQPQLNVISIIISILLIIVLIYAKIEKVQLTSNGSLTYLWGALAQLARAPALQAGGPGFESPTLHQVLCPSKDGLKAWWDPPYIWGGLGFDLGHSTRIYKNTTLCVGD